MQPLPSLPWRKRDVSLLSGCHIMNLPPYCAGVTQYIFSIIISPLVKMWDMAQCQPEKLPTCRFCSWTRRRTSGETKWVIWVLIGLPNCKYSLAKGAHMAVLQLLSMFIVDNIPVMVILRRLRRNIIGKALCWIVWHNVHSQQHTYVSSSYRSNRLGLSHGDPYTVHRGVCLELCYCNMVEWFWCDSSLILTTNWFPSVLWYCWFGHLACKNRLRNDTLCFKKNVTLLVIR